MTSLTYEDFKNKDDATIDALISKDVVHLRKDEVNKYVIMSEESYNKIISNYFEAETEYSLKQYESGKFSSGDSTKLFSALDV